jgi:2-polyprenyl-3-methyl-5-hydroxy-6-metoxy-1,4-benzoquinol methylase
MTVAREYKFMEWTDERVKRFWDYESQFPENYFTYQVGKVVVDQLSKFFSGARNVLDYGAGPGFLIPHLLNKGLEVWALEFSDESLAKLKNRFMDETNFMGVFDIDELIKSKTKFDLIMVIEVIEHLNDVHLQALLNTLQSVLADNGIVIFTTPNNEDLSRSMVYCPDSDQVFHRWQHVRSWSKSNLRAFLQNNQFRLIDVFETNFSLSESIVHRIKQKIKSFLKMIIRRKPPLIYMPHLAAIASKPYPRE